MAMAHRLKPGYSRIIDPLKQVLGDLQLRPVKNIRFTFDPYHSQVRSIREALYFLKLPRIMRTNFNCTSKIDVKSDRCDPEIKVSFNDDHKLVFKTANLTTLEILEKLSTVCKEKDPKKDDPVDLILKSKKK